jgi:hypothetical protein
LRIIIDWYSKHDIADHPFLFQHHAIWFSEALLPTPFRSRYRSDPRAEAHTHADGIIGHISIGISAKADARLLDNATQLVVAEAKIYSPLSGGTRNAPNFNQAARSVACITELLSQANRLPSQMTSLAFFVVAPEAQIKNGVFIQPLNKDAIMAAVQARAETFSSELGGWIDEWFFPTIKAMHIGALSWESLIGFIASDDPETSEWLQEFYERCLIYNGPGLRTAPAAL